MTVTTPAPKFDFPVSRILLNNDPRFGTVTNVTIEFFDVQGYKHIKVYFIAKEIETILNYSMIKNSLSRLPQENKLILRNVNLKGCNLRPFGITVPKRGLLMIDIAGLNRLIMRSNLPKAIEYQNWVFEDVLPSIWMEGMYINPIKANQYIRSIFSETLYNITEKDPNFRTVNINDVEKHPILSSNNYTLIENDKMLKIRIFDIAFYLFTGIRLSNMSDISIENPFITAFDIGGPEMVNNIMHSVMDTISKLYAGYSLDILENISYSIDPTMSLYNIPNKGSKYIDYQNSKSKPVKLDIDSLNKPKENVGINIDKVVEK